MTRESLAGSSQDGTDVTRSAPSADALFDVLANGYRRSILSYLVEANEEVAVEELVDHVVAAVDDDGRSGDDRDRRDKRDHVRVLLHHAHLPKMADVGVVEYDRERKRAKATAAAATIDRFLPAERGSEDGRQS